MLYTALGPSWHPTRCDKCTGYCCPVTLAALEADGQYNENNVLMVVWNSPKRISCKDFASTMQLML